MEDYEQIYQFLVGRYPASFSKNQKRALRRKCKNFEVKAGYLQPGTDVWKQLRPHLLQCLETGTITNFPRGSRRRKTKVFQSRLPKMTNISVYCSCRETSEGKMVQCNKCHEWFHDRCIPPTREEVWTNKLFKWYCGQCIIG